MRFLRDATDVEVLAVTPDGAATRREVTSRGGTWGVWQIEARDDIGAVGTQDPATGNLGTIAALYDERLRWMHAGTAGAVRDLATHAHFLSELVATRPLPLPIIITDAACGWDRQILDGAHRLYALYEFMHAHPDQQQTLYWNRRHAP